MSVKIFRIEGIITKTNNIMPFSKDIRALKSEDAIEKIYTDFGSHHKVKRFHVKITKINEISLEETRDDIIRELSEG
ncbi:MAG: 50S ribosomal protein L18Ae [Candidatus Bathyarchaeota archaeon]